MMFFPGLTGLILIVVTNIEKFVRKEKSKSYIQFFASVKRLFLFPPLIIQAVSTSRKLNNSSVQTIHMLLYDLNKTAL